MTLGLETVQHFLRVAGVGGINAVTVEQFQCIEDGSGILGTCAAGQCPQRITHQLLTVGFSDQHRKGGVFRRDVGEPLTKCQARDDVHHIAEIDALIRSQPCAVA